MRNLKRTTLYIMNITDIFSLVMAFIVSYVIRFEILTKTNSQAMTEPYMMLLFCIILAYLLINIFFLYNDDFMERNSGKELLAALKMVLYVMILIILFLFFFKISSQYSRIQIGIFSVSAFVIDVLCRIVMKKYVLPRYKNSNDSEKIILAAPLAHIETILKKLDKPLNWNSKVIGLVVTDFDKKGETIGRLQVISNAACMCEDIANAEADSVFIAVQAQESRVADWVQQLQAIGKTVHVKVGEYYFNESNRVIDKLSEYAVVSYLPHQPVRNRQIIIKRALDLIIAVSLLPVYLIVFVVTAIFTELESPGKVLTSGIRIGKNGRRFYQYRFRVFRIDAHNRLNKGKSPYTKIGKILKLTHLDGLPLLINVLYGDMSFVGPKSPTVKEFLQYSLEQRRNLCVTTGVVGYWNCGDDKEEVVRAEKDYINGWNLLQDFKIGLEMIVRYVTFHSKRKKYTNEMREEALEQIAEYESYKRPLQYDRQYYVRKYTVADRFYQAVKRIIDIVGAVVGITVLSPVFLIVAGLVIADDGGNPFYGHTRVGKNGKKITVYKFRSMRKDAGDLEKLLTPEQLAQYKKEFKIDNDPRITKVGNFIRKTSIDELPQLFNILKGDISIVGPRPIVEKETEIYGKDIAKLLSVKPGLTGYWQAYARNNATYQSGERQKMEMYYVEHQSLWLDIKILFKTVESVFRQDGAQ